MTKQLGKTSRSVTALSVERDRQTTTIVIGRDPRLLAALGLRVDDWDSIADRGVFELLDRSEPCSLEVTFEVPSSAHGGSCAVSWHFGSREVFALGTVRHHTVEIRINDVVSS